MDKKYLKTYEGLNHVADLINLLASDEDRTPEETQFLDGICDTCQTLIVEMHQKLGCLIQ
jgi:hypothetical protein